MNPSTTASRSHLFVIRGDITQLACDAWLLPTDSEYSITAPWHAALPDLGNRVERSKRAGFGETGLAMELHGTRHGDPAPVLTAVPLHGVSTSEEFAPAIRAFVAEGARIAKRRTITTRQRPLVAMPFFGTKGGGAHLLARDVLRTIFSAAGAAAEEWEVDVALVLRDPAAVALAQTIRREGESAFPLQPDLLAHARRLGELARHGRIVPFMGAGVSVSAGGPTWQALLDDLRTAVGVDADLEDALKRSDLDPLDAATILSRIATEKRLRPSFYRRVAMLVERPRWGLAPALLALLRTEGAITLNYDTLFERASADSGAPRRVIPGPGGWVDADHWLLKLHGSADRPETIVLTRDDYLGYDSDRAALSSLVKATLLTKHMLFVGFGLKDDHFHEIVHDVRKAVSDEARDSSASATVLKLRDDPMDRYLWSGVMEPVSLAGDDGYAGAARRLEILLDAIACFASDSHSYFLAPHFEHGLSKAEKELRRKLLALESVSSEAKKTAAWERVEAVLRELGRP